MAKRKNTSSPKQAAKRARLTGTESVIEQANPYLLATAKFPTVWKVGRTQSKDHLPNDESRGAMDQPPPE